MSTENVRVNPENTVAGRQTRVIDNPNFDDDARRLAALIAQDGQEVPCLGYRDAKGDIVVYDGLTRRRAVELLREGVTAVDPADGQTRTFQDPDAKLWVVVNDEIKSEEDAFVAGLMANVARNEMTDLQEAKAQAVLRDEFKWPDKKIAAHWGYTNQNRVMELKKLLKAPEPVQNAVHEGKMAVSAAVALTKIKADQRDAVLAAATDEKTGKVRGEVIRDALREMGFDESGKAEPQTAKSSSEKKDKGKSKPDSEKAQAQESPSSVGIPRNLRHLRAFTEELLRIPDEGKGAYRPEIKGFFRKLEDWLSGKCGDRALYNAIDAL